MKKVLAILALIVSMHAGALAQKKVSRPFKKNTAIPFIGITTSFGAGLDDFDTGIIAEDGETVYLSTGGGMSIGVIGNMPILEGPWCITGEVNFQFTRLTPKLSNADGGFHHFNIIPGVRRLIPVGRRSNFLSAGAGAVFSMAPSAEVNASEIIGGFDYGFIYKNSVGWALNADYILWTPGEKLGAVFGLRYTNMKHHASKFEVNGVEYEINDEVHGILPDEMDKPDGSGLDLILALVYRL